MIPAASVQMHQFEAHSGPRGLYVLTPDAMDSERLYSHTEAVLGAGVRWLQYRNKVANSALKREQAQGLRALTRAHGAALIINDDVPLALAVQADGVHLGRDDVDVQAARALLGPHAVIGASAYADLARAKAATEAGASYVAFGALFASRVKPHAPCAPLTLLTEARALGLHVVGIGGIDESNVQQVLAAGAHAAALISAVYDAPDPAAATQRLFSAMATGTP